MTKNRFKLVPAVAIILKKDNQVLLHQRKNTGYADGQWAYIGGGVDGNETIRQAAVREVKEEVGATIHEEDIKEEYLIFSTTFLKIS